MGKSKKGRKRTKSTVCSECSDRECNFIEQCPRDWAEMVSNAHTAGRKRWMEPKKYDLNVIPPLPEMKLIHGNQSKKLAEIYGNRFNLFTSQYIMQVSSVCFDLAYTLLLKDDFDKAENVYTEGMNVSLQLLKADPHSKDLCFTYFKRLVTAGHVNYCVIKYDRKNQQPCGKAIMMYTDVLGSLTLASCVETLVPLSMSESRFLTSL